ETGNIRRLTRWVLAAGIAEARRWKEAGRKLKLALNLSVRDLEDRDLPRHVANLLAAHQVGGDALTLEVTESAAMRHPDNAIGIMRQLADLGITIAIDDFGVGQSSLTYLRR
ncbi:MAG: EAL domain-containing protein, partial [Xanthomonadales bacterium]|nr:EAL domain-containing protein [Xanthomonadales bacterium]